MIWLGLYLIGCICALITCLILAKKSGSIWELSAADWGFVAYFMVTYPFYVYVLLRIKYLDWQIARQNRR